MEFTIRPIEPRDVHGTAELRRMPGVFENILGLPSARDGQSEAYLNALGSNTHQFVAVVQNADGTETVIGNAGLTVAQNPRLCHTGSLGIMVHRDFQNQGVGAALIEAVLDVADNWLMLVRVELTVFADNARAIHLYEKFGFENEGLRRFAAIRNGVYENEYAMARIRPGFRP